jgi:hypothetical protein
VNLINIYYGTMSSEVAKCYWEARGNGGANCSTAALLHLTRGIKLRDEFVELSLRVLDISEIAVLAGIEMYETAGLFCNAVKMPDDSTPSEFFSNANRFARHERPWCDFRGGLVRCDRTNREGRVIKHVITITGINPNHKATFMDTGPVSKRPVPLCRKASLSRFDGWIIPPGSTDTRALVVFTEPLNSPLIRYRGDYRHEIEMIYEHWLWLLENNRLDN